MGGDHAPHVEVEGAVLAAKEYGSQIILVGDAEIVEKELSKYAVKDLPIYVKQASEVIRMDESPSKALRKKDSSMRVAFDLVKNGEADAVVSAGNSGAAMATAMVVLRKLEGVDRPAIATVMPTLKGACVVLDVGANVDCKPFHLAQFAVMGDVYAQFILKKERPRVGLLSNGSEETKGTDLTRETHAILKQLPMNYIGYIEGRDIFAGNADVVVCDGFVGNVVLKTSEGLADAIGKMLKEEILKSPFAKFGYLLSKEAFGRFKKKVDYSEYGGAPLLGIDGVGIISHGSSTPNAIKNAIRVAQEFASSSANDLLLDHIKKSDIEKLGKKAA
ncbi:MAG: phosphate:acyl-[acyl carrier protein] acyltransferase [Deltaproteobacteria bacterium]|nr:phosphate:acyl-[acyl carrier protein] acyltransferase [Deltaproteobacteria bacterium]